MQTVTAIAHPNIALIKYWGNRDPVLRIPANGSISMNLDGLQTRTTVTFDAGLAKDQITLNAWISAGGRSCNVISPPWQPWRSWTAT